MADQISVNPSSDGVSLHHVTHWTKSDSGGEVQEGLHHWQKEQRSFHEKLNL